MADICQIRLLGLMIISSLLTGMTENRDVFSSSGDDVSLPCDNALSGCTSTTWNYNTNIRSSAVELFAYGKNKNNIKRPERLSLGSDCSLNINKTTEEDHGLYTCKQYVNDTQYGTDTSVSLHVLHVSSTQNEMRSGSSLTLSCQLFSYENSCDTLVRTEGIQLVWVNQAGVNLHTDSRYLILSQGQCFSTLTTKLLNEDNNKEWRCLLKNSTETKTTASYTVRFIGSNTVIPVTTINKTTSYTVRFIANTMPTTNPDNNTSVKDSSPSNNSTQVIYLGIAALAVVLAAAILWVIFKKRADNRKGTSSSVGSSVMPKVNDKNEYNGTYETINISSLPTLSSNEQTNDVTYCEVTASCKQQMIKNSVPCDDKVTYASINRATN
ncbi:hypothetical protein E1301_Tti007013 [Triplophysa tibetana]|uniref:Ig-like domain-containing protein n=1 Tax=Triplophysa tibetana TaxID=1572043 RepID=A0A5A9N0K7_9TELE|nr:hypothetical protein E1301_Tti007013 [Triplophysa tibetana]